MRFSSRLLHAVLVSVALALPAFAQEEEQEPKKKDPDPQAKAPPVVEEYVFVEGSLPYVPRSNTIVTKLPLERRLTPNNVGVVTEPLMREQFDRVLPSSARVARERLMALAGRHRDDVRRNPGRDDCRGPQATVC